MFIKLKHAIIGLIYAAIGAVLLAFGKDWFGWDDVVRSSIVTLIFATLVTYLTIAHEWWKRGEEETNKHKSIMLSVYLEILERLEYLEDLYSDANQRIKAFAFIPSFKNNAWDTACSLGYIRPQEEFGAKLVYVYDQTKNINYLMGKTTEAVVNSNFNPSNETKQFLNNMHGLIQNQIRSAVTLLKEMKNKLEHDLNISEDEVVRLKKDIQKRMMKLRYEMKEEEQQSGRKV